MRIKGSFYLLHPVSENKVFERSIQPKIADMGSNLDICRIISKPE